MKLFRRILSFARPTKFLFPLYGFTILLAVIFNILGFSFIAPVLKVLIDTSSDYSELRQVTAPEFTLSFEYIKEGIEYLKSLILTSGDTKGEVLFNICLLLIISNFFTNLFTYGAQVIQGVIRARVVNRLRLSFYKKITEQHIGYFNSEQKGDIISRMTMDIQEIENSVISSLNIFLRDPIKLILLLTFLFAISIQLTLFSMLVLPISGIIIGLLSKKLKKKASQSQETLGKTMSLIDETIVGLRVIKAFNALNFMVNKFSKMNNRYKKISISMTNKRSAASPLSQFLGVGVMCFVIFFGGNEVFNNRMTGDIFIVYIVLFAQLIEPIKAIANAIGNIQRGLVSGKRVFEILDSFSPIQDKENANDLQRFEDEIEFKDVQFAYEENLVLKNINLKVKKGSTVALVGPSGGGKSTLIDLIPRFHDPKNGQVTIDGQDLRDLKMECIRQHMGIVTQQSILFNDSIRNNIAFGIEATDAEIENAAKIANAHDFIIKSEKGYDTIIGDQGNKLSGGQKQRITIARAVLKNPAILLLDEATSALDSESEHLVQEALTNLLQNRTSIVIAHRLSTIQHADKIIVIKEGEIVEEGTHEELLALEGLYFKLDEMQNTHH